MTFVVELNRVVKRYMALGFTTLVSGSTASESGIAIDGIRISKLCLVLTDQTLLCFGNQGSKFGNKKGGSHTQKLYLVTTLTSLFWTFSVCLSIMP